ncbi:MAG: hypothetical protein JXP34_03150 [Planctomycetes bacterium]|nr:hypothetical protein [Planctomycetota bacterium]
MKPRANPPQGGSAVPSPSRERRDPQGDAPAGALARAAAAVRRLIAEKKEKKAVEEAKRAHKVLATADSEALLVDAYLARAEGLAARGLVAESRVILDLLDERHSAARARTADLRTALAGHAGDIEAILRRLRDPDLTSAQRAAAEGALARHLAHPSRITDSTVLPDGHPLKDAARALSAAFDAVTTRPVTDEEIALPEISRRSPLAAWKLLVRAIAHFHRGDGEGCRRALVAIDQAAPPARLVPALRALVSGEGTEELRRSAARLAARIRGTDDRLRETLEALDRALERGKRKEIFRRIQNAVRVCRESAPALLDALKQRISIRCLLLDLDAEDVRTAMGGPSRPDAHFWRLFARGVEMKGDAALAAALWEEFRRNAISQGWFPANGFEEAAIYLHMAELARTYPPDDLPDVRRAFARRIGDGLASYYHGQPDEVRAAAPKTSSSDGRQDFLDPDRLYAKACAIDPNPEDFRAWLDWTKARGGDAAAVDRVAEAWRDAVPSDPRPVLALTQSAEKRKALRKAIGHLERAEAIDALNPAVRRARLRLELASLRRHLQQRKPHLAEKDLARLEALPQAKDGDRPHAIAAFRWACASARGDGEDARARADEVAKGIGSPAMAALVLRAAAKVCSFPRPQWPPVPAPPDPAGDGRTVSGLARACTLGRDIGLKIEIPRSWRQGLLVEIPESAGTVAAGPLRWLAESAADQGEDQIAYALTNLGLAFGESEAGWSLLVRARSLPQPLRQRRCQCAAAAAEIGRGHGDADLVEQAIEFVREEMRGPFAIPAAAAPLPREMASMTAAMVRETIAKERKASDYPVIDASIPFRLEESTGGNGGDGEQVGDDIPFGPHEFDEEDDIDFEGLFLDEEEGDLLGDLSGLPPEIAIELSRAVLRLIERGEMPGDFEDLLERDPPLRAAVEKLFKDEFFGRSMPSGRKKKRKRRGRRGGKR